MHLLFQKLATVEVYPSSAFFHILGFFPSGHQAHLLPFPGLHGRIADVVNASGRLGIVSMSSSPSNNGIVSPSAVSDLCRTFYSLIHCLFCPTADAPGKCQNCHHTGVPCANNTFKKFCFICFTSLRPCRVFGRTFFPFVNSISNAPITYFLVSAGLMMVSTYPLAAADWTLFCRFSIFCCLLVDRLRQHPAYMILAASFLHPSCRSLHSPMHIPYLRRLPCCSLLCKQFRMLCR